MSMGGVLTVFFFILQSTVTPAESGFRGYETSRWLTVLTVKTEDLCLKEVVL